MGESVLDYLRAKPPHDTANQAGVSLWATYCFMAQLSGTGVTHGKTVGRMYSSS